MGHGLGIGSLRPGVQLASAEMSALFSIDVMPVATATSGSVAMNVTTVRVGVAAPDPALHVESAAPGFYAREPTVIGTLDSSGLPILEAVPIFAAAGLAIVDWRLQRQRADRVADPSSRRRVPRIASP